LSLASFKSRAVLLFWYRLARVVLEQRPLRGAVVVVVLWSFVEVESGVDDLSHRSPSAAVNGSATAQLTIAIINRLIVST